MIYIAGPGHGGPALVANTYLEGTYSEYYPHVSEDVDGMRELFRQFSFPGGIPSHVAPETPGSIHEGGELGYALSHAYGAAFDNPDLIVACVIGDGEAETGPLATSWHSNKFLNPARDGAVLPILHLNGYKIAGPTVLARIPREELTQLLTGYGYEPFYVDKQPTHRGDASDHGAHARSQSSRASATFRREARRDGFKTRPRWPAIVLQDAQRLDGPERSRRHRRRRHLALASSAARRSSRKSRRISRMLEAWMRSYRPEELFTDRRPPEAGAARARAAGRRRMGDNPHANGGMLLRDLRLPDFREYAVEAAAIPARDSAEATRVQGALHARCHEAQSGDSELPHLQSRRD